MSDQSQILVPQPAAKIITAWSGVGIAELLQKFGITTWGDAAAAAACMYSLLLILEWLYKKSLPIYTRTKAHIKERKTKGAEGADG